MDFDVAALSLATPSASAPVQSYRPAVAVKNLGIHDANVTGTLSIYDRAAGTLIATMALAANGISPGETRNAVADKLWTPVTADIGRAFLFMATIAYPPDQNLSNNNLQPVTVVVTAAPPTPPPPVEAHADQHEDGAGDEITVQGLSGKLAEAQAPEEHASNHEDGGADQLDVAGLVGELATPQTPKTHATSHQVGGSDVVSGLEPGAHATSHEPGGDDEITGIDPAPHASTHNNAASDELPGFFERASYDEAPVAYAQPMIELVLATVNFDPPSKPSSILMIGSIHIAADQIGDPVECEVHLRGPGIDYKVADLAVWPPPGAPLRFTLPIVKQFAPTPNLPFDITIGVLNVGPNQLIAGLNGNITSLVI